MFFIEHLKSVNLCLIVNKGKLTISWSHYVKIDKRRFDIYGSKRVVEVCSL